MYTVATLLLCTATLRCVDLTHLAVQSFPDTHVLAHPRCLDYGLRIIATYERRHGVQRTRIELGCVKTGGKPRVKHW